VTLLETAARGRFAQRCDWEGSTVVTVHNLGEEEAEATLELGRRRSTSTTCSELREHELLDGGRLPVTLARYGYLCCACAATGSAS
jgi:hypothetical protein